MARPKQPPVVISPPARIILEWLAQRPCRVYDFAEVAAAVNLKRAVVERAIVELRSPRSGGHLKSKTDGGLLLRGRHAYLPRDAQVRARYPDVLHPPEGSASEHPSVLALRSAGEERAAKNAEIEARRAEKLAERARVRRAQKLDRKIAATKERLKWHGIEKDEARAMVPTFDEVVAAGYMPAEAHGIVAEQQALAEGRSAQEAELIGAQERERHLGEMPGDTVPWTADEDVARALGSEAPPPTDAPMYSERFSEAVTSAYEEALAQPVDAIDDAGDESPAATDADSYEPPAGDEDAAGDIIEAGRASAPELAEHVGPATLDNLPQSPEPGDRRPAGLRRFHENKSRKKG
jgi:hypothetical protein